MAIHSNYPKTAKIEKPNGIFIVFNDFELEDSFSNFLGFLGAKLNVAIPDVMQHPYSLSTEIILPQGKMTAMFHDDVGCCVRVAPEAQSLADHIVHACYGGN